MPKLKYKFEGMLESIGLIRNKSIGLALSGGGARGFSHIGVLKALDASGIKPGIISGVSSGSIATVLYAAGLQPNEIFDCFINYSRHFTDFIEWTLPREGFLRLDKFGRMLDSWLPVKNLEELKIPAFVCAADLDNGKSVGWAKGEIVPRVLASCSIPIVFPPVKINNTNYVDGGCLRNLPAWAIRNHCDLLIGSNCSPLNRHYKYKNSIIDIALRSFQLMAKSNTLLDIQLCDHVIQSSGLAKYKTFDMTEVEKIVDEGYDAAMRVIEEIRSK